MVMNRPQNEIVVLDKLSYASQGFDRLRATGVLDKVKVYSVDLYRELPEGIRYEIGSNVEFIVHMAAETHVDNSIAHPVPFVKNNVNSTLTMLEWARELTSLRAFFYFSTDEVYGPALNGRLFKEDDRHSPANPYSASKSACEQLMLAYENTYKIPTIMINVMNAFGERQHPEKFIPKVINTVLQGGTIKIHSYPDKKTAGTRFYIHAANIAAAVLFLLDKGRPGEVYHLVGDREVSNLELAQMIAKVIGKPLKYEMVDFHSTRPGHDLRYGLNGDKMAKLGWVPPQTFEQSLKKVVEWTLHNPEWLVGLEPSVVSKL
jgi:dTDP-glucose 4,6-dehydratase